MFIGYNENSSWLGIGAIMVHYQRIVAALLFALITTGPAHAQESTGQSEPSAAAMTADLLVVRPLSFGATFLGTAVFLVGLPVIAASQSTRQAAEKLIEDPMKYTFQRPLGQSF
jgi:hypothetical protein